LTRVFLIRISENPTTSAEDVRNCAHVNKKGNVVSRGAFDSVVARLP